MSVTFDSLVRTSLLDAKREVTHLFWIVSYDGIPPELESSSRDDAINAAERSQSTHFASAPSRTQRFGKSKR